MVGYNLIKKKTQIKKFDPELQKREITRLYTFQRTYPCWEITESRKWNLRALYRENTYGKIASFLFFFLCFASFVFLDCAWCVFFLFLLMLLLWVWSLRMSKLHWISLNCFNHSLSSLLSLSILGIKLLLHTTTNKAKIFSALMSHGCMSWMNIIHVMGHPSHRPYHKPLSFYFVLPWLTIFQYELCRLLLLDRCTTSPDLSALFQRVLYHLR